MKDFHSFRESLTESKIRKQDPDKLAAKIVSKDFEVDEEEGLMLSDLVAEVLRQFYADIKKDDSSPKESWTDATLDVFDEYGYSAGGKVYKAFDKAVGKRGLKMIGLS